MQQHDLPRRREGPGRIQALRQRNQSSGRLPLDRQGRHLPGLNQRVEGSRNLAGGSERAGAKPASSQEYGSRASRRWQAPHAGLARSSAAVGLDSKRGALRGGRRRGGSGRAETGSSPRRPGSRWRRDPSIASAGPSLGRESRGFHRPGEIHLKRRGHGGRGLQRPGQSRQSRRNCHRHPRGRPGGQQPGWSGGGSGGELSRCSQLQPYRRLCFRQAAPLQPGPLATLE